MNQEDQDDQAREDLEEQLIEVGEQLGFDSRCHASSTHTTAIYEAEDGAFHSFYLAPVGSDAVLPV